MDHNKQEVLPKEEPVEDDDNNGLFLSMDEDELSEEGDANTFKPRPRLPTPYVNKRPLSYLMKGLDDGSLDVDPDYQREVVWTVERMTGLINSLMEDFYVPPIILNVRKNSETDQFTRICVDGKQRLSSVRAFVKGLIPCHDKHGKKWWFSGAEKKPRTKLLPESEKRKFLDKDFVVFEYENLSPAQEEDLFSRVQMGIQLTGPEKMRAGSGRWQEFVKMFEKDFVCLTKLLKDPTRAKGFRVILSSFSQIVEVQNARSTNSVARWRATPAALQQLLENHAALDDRMRSHLTNVFHKYAELVEAEPSYFRQEIGALPGGETFAPLEFLCVAVFISMHSESRDNNQLLGDLWQMRLFLREQPDIRTNRDTWSRAWKYINKPKSFKKAVKGAPPKRGSDTRNGTSTRPPSGGRLTVVAAKTTSKETRASVKDILNSKAPLSQRPQPPNTMPPKKGGQVAFHAVLRKGVATPLKRSQLEKFDNDKPKQKPPIGPGSSYTEPLVLDSPPASPKVRPVEQPNAALQSPSPAASDNTRRLSAPVSPVALIANPSDLHPRPQIPPTNSGAQGLAHPGAAPTANMGSPTNMNFQQNLTTEKATLERFLQSQDPPTGDGRSVTNDSRLPRQSAPVAPMVQPAQIASKPAHHDGADNNQPIKGPPNLSLQLPALQTLSKSTSPATPDSGTPESEAESARQQLLAKFRSMTERNIQRNVESLVIKTEYPGSANKPIDSAVCLDSPNAPLKTPQLPVRARKRKPEPSVFIPKPTKKRTM